MAADTWAEGVPGGRRGREAWEAKGCARQKGIRRLGTSLAAQSCECACVEIFTDTWPQPPCLCWLGSRDAEGAGKPP